MIPLDVLYEDNHLLVINKRAGVLVQGDETGDTPLVELGKKYIKQKHDKPGDVFLGVVHRLDRPVSGVVVFARTSKALARMNELFRARETEKVYWAITDAKPAKDEATLVHWLRKDEKKNRTTAFIRETEGTQHAELHYRLLKRNRNRFLLEVRPVTGRPHQIRVQLSSIHCPILGDLKYDSSVPTGDSSIGLHARSLSFIHPVKKEKILLTASLPETPWWK